MPVFHQLMDYFRFFTQHVTCCSDGGEIWHGRVDLQSTSSHPNQCRMRAKGPKNSNFYEILEHNARSDFHKIFSICGELHIWSFIKSGPSYGSFKSGLLGDSITKCCRSENVVKFGVFLPLQGDRIHDTDEMWLM